MSLASLFRGAAAALLVSSSAFAADPSTVLAEFSRDLKELDGRFEQRVFDADERLTEQSEGRIALAAPRQFRWEYEQPFPQLIVADGDQVWIYDPDLEQVTVRRQSDEEQASPLAALIDPGELERQFIVADAGEKDGIHWIKLTPRKSEEGAFTECRLGLRGGELVHMAMVDGLSQRTEIEFSEWRRNPGLAADTFRFDPPEGVEVVGETIEHADVFPVKD